MGKVIKASCGNGTMILQMWSQTHNSREHNRAQSLGFIGNTIKKIQEKQEGGTEQALKANAEDETEEPAVCDGRALTRGRLENYNQQRYILLQKKKSENSNWC